MSPLALGLDIGSTTVKAVVLRGDDIVFSDYRRHNADVRGELRSLLTTLAESFPDIELRTSVTGSGGVHVADLMGVTFVQEVIAGTEAVQRFLPDADVVIELGGEDAKITYLHPVPEQRMNGTCAGGTGAFIDQMAVLLQTDAAGLDDLAGQYRNLYPIASRCGVFAKSDLQPLLNQGAAHTDLAASVFQAVALQTISGLAAGHPIRGNVVLLGGPLHFLPQLQVAYQRALAAQATSFTTPENAHLYVAIGAALLAGDGSRGPWRNCWRARGRVVPLDPGHDRPASVVRRRRRTRRVPRAARAGHGADAPTWPRPPGLLPRHRRGLHHHQGCPARRRRAHPLQPLRLQSGRPRRRRRRDRPRVRGAPRPRAASPVPASPATARDWSAPRCGSTTARSRRWPTTGRPSTSRPVSPAVIDIGGQDMKYLKIRGGAVDSIAVNEACSSGCGSFLQTFAETMGTDVSTFAADGDARSATSGGPR